VRARISTAPPGGNGTSRCTGFDGKLSWAWRVGASTKSAKLASVTRAMPRRIEVAIGLLPHQNRYHVSALKAALVVRASKTARPYFATNGSAAQLAWAREFCAFRMTCQSGVSIH